MLTAEQYSFRDLIKKQFELHFCKVDAIWVKVYAKNGMVCECQELFESSLLDADDERKSASSVMGSSKEASIIHFSNLCITYFYSCAGIFSIWV